MDTKLLLDTIRQKIQEGTATIEDMREVVALIRATRGKPSPRTKAKPSKKENLELNRFFDF